MRPLNNPGNETPSGTYGRVQLVCKKVHLQSSLELPLEYNQDALMNQGSLWLVNYLKLVVTLPFTVVLLVLLLAKG